MDPRTVEAFGTAACGVSVVDTAEVMFEAGQHLDETEQPQPRDD